MKTYFEIVEGKNYRQLTAVEKEMIQDRQTALAIAWQDETDQSRKWEIEDELHASFKGLIKGMAYRQAEKSFSMEQEEFEGLISLVLVETLAGNGDEAQVDMYGQRLITFDRTMDKPFQPIFMTNVSNVIKMMYRAKGYDLHDTADRQQETEDFLNQGTSSSEVINGSKQIKSPTDFIGNVETAIVTNEILNDLFGDNDVKKTIVHMTVQGFKRNEIVSAIMSEGKSTDAVAKQVNRTVKQFKEAYLNLMQAELV
jgi:hypothetical protein